DRWMTGTPNFECIAGIRACIDYLADLGEGGDRRAKLRHAFQKIGDYERELGQRLLDGLSRIPDVNVLGITDPARWKERAPTISIVHAKRPANAVAGHLAKQGIFV